MSGDLDELERELIDGQNSDTESGETVAEVLAKLEKAWLNEKFSPEILPQETEYVEGMLEQISVMEENISELPRNDIRVDIHTIELERIKYIITSYLRCRLKKIEQFAVYILEQEQTRDEDLKYLSPHETKFAEDYVKNLDTHLESVLKEMPWNCQTLEAAQKRIKPDIDSYVFLRVVKAPAADIMIKDVFEKRDEVIEDLQESSQHLLPYSSIASCVKDGSMQLI